MLRAPLSSRLFAREQAASIKTLVAQLVELAGGQNENTALVTMTKTGFHDPVRGVVRASPSPRLHEDGSSRIMIDKSQRLIISCRPSIANSERLLPTNVNKETSPHPFYHSTLLTADAPPHRRAGQDIDGARPALCTDLRLEPQETAIPLFSRGRHYAAHTSDNRHATAFAFGTEPGAETMPSGSTCRCSMAFRHHLPKG